MRTAFHSMDDFKQYMNTKLKDFNSKTSQQDAALTISSRTIQKDKESMNVCEKQLRGFTIDKHLIAFILMSTRRG